MIQVFQNREYESFLAYLDEFVWVVIMIEMLNPKFQWLHEIATTLHKFHWRFWIIYSDAIAKAKKLIRKFIAQNLKQVSLTQIFFSFGNGV